MTEKTKRLVLNALDLARGDDLERAKAAFRGLSDADMDRQYGESGQTRREVVEGYQKHVDAVEAAIREVEAIK